MISKLVRPPGTTSGEPVSAGVIYISDATGNKTWCILVDARKVGAEGPFIVIEQVDAAGNRVAAAPAMEIDLGVELLTNFAAAATPTDKTLKLRETKGCDESGNEAYCLVLRSKWYATAIGTDFD